MNELIVVRHGEGVHLTGTDKTGGWSDARLTERGWQQARLTGQKLAEIIGDRPFQFYASDIVRAHETAQGIAESLGVQPVLAEGLREFNNGIAAGMTKEEADRVSIPMTQPVLDWIPYPGGDSWRTMSERLAAFMDSIKEDPHDLTLVVTHGGSGNAIVHWWLRLGCGGHRTAYDLDVCSISIFRINEYGERVIARLNDTSHLMSLEPASG
jgi:broad specificity phosphatase PhoE